MWTCCTSSCFLTQVFHSVHNSTAQCIDLEIKIQQRHKPNIIDTTARSRRQGGAGAVVDAAGQNVAVVAGDGEVVVHAAIPALLVLQQQPRVVERRQLHEPKVAVPHVAPSRPRGRVVGEAGAAAAHHDVRRRREGAGVEVGPLGHARVLRSTHPIRSGQSDKSSTE
jgi:hypothetical protein